MEAVEEESADAPVAGLTLLQVHAAIEESGIKIGYSTLSELLKVGDAMQQLGVGGTRGRREFPAEVVDILATFLPEFRTADTKNSQFAAELKKYLRKRQRATVKVKEELDDDDLDEIRQRAETALALVPSSDVTSLSEIAASEGRARGLAEGDLQFGKLLTAKEAAAICQVSERMLRQTIPPFVRFGKTAQGDRWRISDLFSKG